MKSFQLAFIILILSSLFCTTAEAGLWGLLFGSVGGYAACQTACNVAWVSCYASAGLVAGTVTAGTGVPAAALACNGIQGACMASCATAFIVL